MEATAFKVDPAKDGERGQAVKIVVVRDQSDYLNFIGVSDGSAPRCNIGDPSARRTRTALSALGSVLAAEAAADIENSVNLTVAWSIGI